MGVRQTQLPLTASHCFNSSGGENKDFMAVTNISSCAFYSPQLLRLLGSCRSWKIHKMHVNFYVQLFHVPCFGPSSYPIYNPAPRPLTVWTPPTPARAQQRSIPSPAPCCHLHDGL